MEMNAGEYIKDVAISVTLSWAIQQVCCASSDSPDWKQLSRKASDFPAHRKSLSFVHACFLIC